MVKLLQLGTVIVVLKMRGSHAICGARKGRSQDGSGVPRGRYKLRGPEGPNTNTGAPMVREIRGISACAIGVASTRARAALRLLRSNGERLASHRPSELGRWTALFSVVCLLSLGSVGANAQVQHIYDENGRLAGTIDPTGNAARFTYDAAGNITAISRFTSTQVSIIEFTPNTGPGTSSGVGVAPLPWRVLDLILKRS